MNRMYPSDMDAAEAVSGIPESEIRARDEEREREQRHAEFVATLKHEYAIDGHTWSVVAQLAADSLSCSDASRGVNGKAAALPYVDFIVSDGVPALFAALSRAMREVEVERENLLDRR